MSKKRKGKAAAINTLSKNKKRITEEPNSTPKYSAYLPIAKKLIVAISFVLNLASAYFLFIPKIIPSVYLPNNSRNPFEALFTVTNSGYFDITDIYINQDNFKFSTNISNPATLYTHDPKGKLAGIDKLNIDRIKRDHSDTVELGKMFGLVSSRADSASFSLKVTYSVWFSPFNMSDTYSYKLVKIITGEYAWVEYGR